MFSYDLSKIPFKSGLIISLLIFVGLIAPMWFIFQFSNDLFRDTDLIKLIFISLAIGIPVVLINVLVEGFLKLNSSDEDAIDDLVIYEIIVKASVSVFIIFYFPCIKSFFITDTLNEAIWQSISCQFFLILFDFLRYKKKPKKVTEAPKIVEAAPSLDGIPNQ